MNRKILTIALFSLGCAASAAQASFPLKVEKDSVIYLADSRGNRLLDYSVCGYRNSNVALPDVPVSVFVPWKPGDNSARIAKAVGYVASLPPAKRGAILLDKGVFEISEPIRIPASGIVVRGVDKHATVLKKTGYDRGAAIYIEGVNDLRFTDTIAVTAPYVPLNSRSLPVASTKGLKAGSRVMVVRPSTKEWIASLGCDIFGGGISALGWKPGMVDLIWDRTVTAADGAVSIDAPLAMTLDAADASAAVLPYSWPGRIAECGVENLTIESAFDPSLPKDENHCWTGVSIDNAENCWVRAVDFKHLAGSAVMVQPGGSRITVEDCIASEPVSEIGGMRRCTFHTMGQLVLFQRCHSSHGIHDFSAGSSAAGPNAFVQCDASESLGFSGAIGKWAPGLLFDVVNIDGNDISLKNLGQDKNGAGWNSGNSTVWQCTAAGIDCYTPEDDSPNTAYGCWAQFSGDGYWAQSNNHVQPRSLFYHQLSSRLGTDCTDRGRILPLSTSASSSPTVKVAMELAKEAYTPRLTMPVWVDAGPFTAATDAKGVKSIDDIKLASTEKSAPASRFAIEGGVMTFNGGIIVGGRHEVPWWNGNLTSAFLPKAKPHVTRFVPGREGLGLTDRIDSTVCWMKNAGIAVLDHNYGLWYDRRRDDHERVRRRDGDVWGPFYEQPFTRSGEGTAWEGLSKYDLSRPNEWYFGRLREFAAKGAPEGLLLFNEHYFQHNILEAGAHWVDCPWRSVNNVNATDFPEPVPFAGDKRIFVADMFYDVTHPVRRELHRQYIRENLNRFADAPNAVHLISAEFTGPLHFVEFWLDVIAEWERETGRCATVALSVTKDVQDAILADPKRSPVVDIIDIRYWHYKTDGLYAPEGGKNLAPRQHARQMKVGKVTFGEAYRAVSEYRRQYPDKAVTYNAQNYPEMAWAVFMAGGSCPGIPVKDRAFLTDAAAMRPAESPDANLRLLADPATGNTIVYALADATLSPALPAGSYRVTEIAPRSGQTRLISKRHRPGSPLTLSAGKVYHFHKL